MDAAILPLFKALADEQRIKIIALIADEGRTVEDVASALGIHPRLVTRQLGVLANAGLAELDETGGRGTYRFRRETLFEAHRLLAREPVAPVLDDDVEAFDRKVLTTFLSDGKLTAIPAQQKKRDVILRFLAERFEPQRMYDEREVNALLREYHDDVASLRRYLVDGGFLQRQIVRTASLGELMEGTPRVEPRVTYWRPLTQP